MTSLFQSWALGSLAVPAGLSLSLFVIKPRGHELLSAMEGSDSSRKHSCVVEHQLQNGSPHSGQPILGNNSEENTRRLVPRHKILSDMS